MAAQEQEGSGSPFIRVLMALPIVGIVVVGLLFLPQNGLEGTAPGCEHRMQEVALAAQAYEVKYGEWPEDVMVLSDTFLHSEPFCATADDTLLLTREAVVCKEHGRVPIDARRN